MGLHFNQSAVLEILFIINGVMNEEKACHHLDLVMIHYEEHLIGNNLILRMQKNTPELKNTKWKFFHLSRIFLRKIKEMRGVL